MYLKKTLQNPLATWTSQVQLQLLKHMHSDNRSTLGIMPTGSGKSMGFYLPAKSFNSDMVTVVICPFKSLVHQVRATADSMGISSVVWTQKRDWNNAKPVPLLIVSGNACGTKEFVKYVLSISNFL